MLIDGNNTQIEAAAAEAARRGVTVTIIIDFIHVLEYCWQAAWSFFDKGEPAAEEWVAGQARKILHGKAPQVAAGIRRRATTCGYSGPERAAPTSAPATSTTSRTTWTTPPRWRKAGPSPPGS